MGGLTSGRQYSVIATSDDDKTVQFGVSFGSSGASSKVDIARDEIRFSYPHNLNDDDTVVYQTETGAATVGGIVSGSTYHVHKIDDTTIKLRDPDKLLPEAMEFSGSSISADTITVDKHGFVNGQPVTYSSPQAFGFTPDDVVAAEDTIFLGKDHGYQAGDEVIYSAAETLIGGLISGRRYFVIHDTEMPNVIKLAQTRADALGLPGDPNVTPPVPPTPPTPIDLVPSTEGSDQFDKHELRKVVDQPIGGLVDGVTYYVAAATANTFQLATDSAGSMIVELDATDPVSSVVLTGKSTIGTEGARSYEQRLGASSFGSEYFRRRRGDAAVGWRGRCTSALQGANR